MSMLAPLYLIGLIAIVVPVWLHLLRKDNPQILDFPSRMFLEATPVANSTSKTLKFRKLLTARLLLISLLVLLFAQPVFNRIGQWLDGDGKVHAIIVDSSYSMRQRESWQEAVSKAEQLINSLPQGVQVLLLTADHRLTLITDAAESLEVHVQALRSLQPGYGRLGYDSLIRQLQNYIDDATTPFIIHLITDAQLSGIPKNIGELVPRGAAELNLVPIGTELEGNVYIRSVETLGQTGKGEVRILVAGADRDSLSQYSVSLVSSKDTELERPVEVGAEGELFARFTDIPLNRGMNRFVAKLNASDILMEDNQFHFALEKGPLERIHILGTRNDAFAEFFLKTALQSDRRFTLTAETDTPIESSKEISLIIVPDASALSETERSELNRFVSDGGSALVVAGNELAHSTNSDWNPPYQPPASIGYVDDTHPMIVNRAAWQDITFYRHKPMQEHSGDRVLVALSDGSPFVVERSTGKGRQLIIASALDSVANDFPTSPIFSPFILQAVRELSGVDDRVDVLTSGSQLVVEPGGQIISPDNKALVPISSLNRESLVVLETPGVYELRGEAKSELVAVNIDRRESLPERISDDFQTDWISLVNNQSVTNSNDDKSIRSDTRVVSLTPWLLPLLLALVIFEVFYANAHIAVPLGKSSTRD